ncbi:MAG TPA: hypothetical protein ENH82_05370 [bacterium]|nr:hypothetical protein [bacterium]
MNNNTNGKVTYRIFLMAIGLVVSIILAATTYTAAQMNDINSSNSLQGERISTNEANVSNILQRLDRFETKLDNILYQISQ